MKDVFRIYMSHQIRGPNEDKATNEEIQDNINKHIIIGTEIKAYLIDWEKMYGFPKMDLYIPAEHDEFVQIAYNRKYLDETSILDVDCGIIDRCSLLIAYGNPTRSRGMKIEIEHAGKVGIPIYYMPSMSYDVIQSLKFTIDLLLKGE